MLIVFPLIYLLAFFFSAKEITGGQKQGGLLFFIFGLSIYTTTLSVLFNLGLRDITIFFQPLKELLILCLLGIGIWQYRQRFKLHIIDILVFGFFCYSLLYLFIPLGDYDFTDRLSALKSTSFFAFIYAFGRLTDIREIYISKNFKYVLVVSIAAAVLVIYEAFIGQHFQTLTGYADYNFYMYDQEPSGNYGLSWTFETENGFKRFASFFANPLEHASATLLALSVIAGLYTFDDNKIRLDLFGKIAFAATQISIFLALSRASFVSYFLMIYVYAFVTKKKLILNMYHFGLIAVVIYFVYLIKNDEIYDFVVDTITFRNASSLGHVIEWVNGIEAMVVNPFGLGLGSSGKVSTSLGLNVGGENQFIIIGVQLGFIGFALYFLLQLFLITYPLNWINRLSGKERKIAITVFLLKVGSIIPLLTADFESYIYISYFVWFLSGLFINIISGKVKKPEASYA